MVLFAGGMNNVFPPLHLFGRKRGECQTAINVDTYDQGKYAPLKPFLAISAAEAASIHSVFRVQDTLIVGTGTTIKYVTSTGGALTSLVTGLSGDPVNFEKVGNWVFYCNGTDQGCIYLTTMKACPWGIDPPTAAPTVAVGAGAGATPNGTYTCAYRYKITLPDGTIVYTSLSPTATVAPASQAISWTIAHASFTGATTIQAELYRTLTGWAGYYLVTTLTSGTTTYTDTYTDAQMLVSTLWDDTYYYGPPSGIDSLYYHAGSDRLFMAVENDIYWTEAGMYWTLVYDETADEYENVNSVYLAGDPITAIVGYDEQMYIGSDGTWRRLRGVSPSSWTWESIDGAVKGPMGWRSCCVTQFGMVYPGNDGFLWIFNGFDTRRIADTFKFSTNPTSNSIAAFDGRFFYLYYGDTTYPEVVYDMYGYPSMPIKPVKTTRTATSIYYDKIHGELYVGTSGGQIQNGEDTTAEVTMSFQTGDIPVSGLLELDALPTLVAYLNTNGDNITITPYYDGVAQDPLTVFSKDSLSWVVLPLPPNQVRTVGFHVSLTTDGTSVELVEPWLIAREHDADRP